MNNCLIGFTGFVGSNLDAQIVFPEKYNSGNIEEIRGRSFDAVYCAAISAAKWVANREPTEDLKKILPLLDCLRDIQAGRFVLISTVDIYREPLNVYEDTPISTEGLHAYGLHRRLFEVFIQERFPVHNVLRLPGLFGMNLKKNAIYDLIHNNQTENIHADSVFQFYNLDRLSSDIDKAIQNGLGTVNLATEPVSMKDVASAAFDMDFENRTERPPARYDMRTRYAGIFSGAGGGNYIQSADEVLREIRGFVARQRKEST